MLEIPALHESLDDVVAWLGRVDDPGAARSAGRLVGSVRGRLERRDGAERGSSAGSWWRRTCRAAASAAGCSSAIEDAAPDGATSYLLFTGARSEDNLRLYQTGRLPLRGELREVPGAVRADQATGGGLADFAGPGRLWQNRSLGPDASTTGCVPAQRSAVHLPQGARRDEASPGTTASKTTDPWATCGADEETP